MTDLNTLIAQMTLEEKAALCTGANSWATTPIERLGVPAMIVSDGPHGVRRVADLTTMTSKSLPATCFPTASGLASSWNVDLAHEMGAALGEECLALNVDVLLGPGVNMKRSPLGGRNFEYFSEDPYLAGEMAASLVEGIQSQGVGTSLKHFAANNQEFQRFTIDARIDERSLREIYLPAFEKVVKRAKPWTVMCSYNKTNGFYGSEQHVLLTEILKEEWGFEGLVVSDWGAVHDRVASLKAGLDWEMPGPKASRVRAVIDAVQSGQLDEAVLDESVRRILRIVFMAAKTPKGTVSFDVDAHHALAQRVSSETMVLLKNNGLLPLQNPQHVAVIGRSAETAHFQGGGSSHINPTRVAMPFTELKKNYPDAELTFAPGYPADDSFKQELIDEAVSLANGADVALLYIALPAFKESEGYDRSDLDLTRQQVALIQAVSAVQPNTVVILNNGAPVVMGDWIEGVAAVLEAWMMGQAGAAAIADILFGRVNPSGKLAETFPLRLNDTPAFLNFPGENGQVRYGEGLYIGYRHYDMRRIPVQFPFGYGLSYTRFEYSNLQVSEKSFNDVDGLTVSLDVTNTGERAGKEVVQLYVHDQKSSLQRPEKELKGFVKVDLQPGETKRVALQLDSRAFAFYHTGYAQWITEDGQFDILVGASAADLRGSVTVSLHATQNLPCILNSESTVRQWLEDPRGSKVTQEIFALMMSQMNQAFAGGEESETVGMDMMGFVMEMPLAGILHFQESLLPASPEAIVADLLVKAHALP